MKKFFRFILMLAVISSAIFALAACGGDKDGTTYKGSASTTYRNKEISISVSVEVDENKIIDIKIDNDSAAATADAFIQKWNEGKDNVIAQLKGKTVTEVLAYTTDVENAGGEAAYKGEVATGATITSNLFIRAVQDALTKITAA